MDNNTLATILWVGAALVLVLYLVRRSRRKRSR
jgi:LPXTG-motif cell wall-anchored protein